MDPHVSDFWPYEHFEPEVTHFFWYKAHDPIVF